MATMPHSSRSFAHDLSADTFRYGSAIGDKEGSLPPTATGESHPKGCTQSKCGHNPILRLRLAISQLVVRSPSLSQGRGGLVPRSRVECKSLSYISKAPNIPLSAMMTDLLRQEIADCRHDPGGESRHAGVDRRRRQAQRTTNCGPGRAIPQVSLSLAERWPWSAPGRSVPGWDGWG